MNSKVVIVEFKFKSLDTGEAMASQELNIALDNIRSVMESEDEDINDQFETALDKLSNVKDPELPKQMLLLLDDRYEFQDFLWVILHVVEKYDVGIYVTSYLDIVIELNDKSPKWAERILIGCLNDNSSLEKIAEKMITLPAARLNTLRTMCIKLLTRNPTQFESSVSFLFPRQ